MSEFTHGPWKVCGVDHSPESGTGLCQAIIRNSTGWEVCRSQHFLQDQHEANARLIAQSPAMYEAIKKRHAKMSELAKQPFTNFDPDFYADLAELDAIIADVEGERCQ